MAHVLWRARYRLVLRARVGNHVSRVERRMGRMLTNVDGGPVAQGRKRGPLRTTPRGRGNGSADQRGWFSSTIASCGSEGLVWPPTDSRRTLADRHGSFAVLAGLGCSGVKHAMAWCLLHGAAPRCGTVAGANGKKDRDPLS
uniref:(northern house mosquito) hypothetical protein n=1 Tax=Culex pipiens TaxID=7175 RepID=A0A8D8GIS9_CULPI